MLIPWLLSIALIIVIVVVLYFTLIQKNLCTNGELSKCPGSDIQICAKKGTNWGKYCPKKEKYGSCNPVIRDKCKKSGGPCYSSGWLRCMSQAYQPTSTGSCPC